MCWDQIRRFFYMIDSSFFLTVFWKIQENFFRWSKIVAEKYKNGFPRKLPIWKWKFTNFVPQLRKKMNNIIAGTKKKLSLLLTRPTHLYVLSRAKSKLDVKKSVHPQKKSYRYKTPPPPTIGVIWEVSWLNCLKNCHKTAVDEAVTSECIDVELLAEIEEMALAEIFSEESGSVVSDDEYLPCIRYDE